MDCRISLFLGLTLCTGCAHFPEWTKGNEVPKSATEEVVRTEMPFKKKGKKQPAAETCVALAALRVSKASEPTCPSLLRKELYEEARVAYHQAIRTDPKCVEAYLGLARLHQKLEDHDRVVQTYKKGIKALPKEPTLQHELGMYWAKQKEWDQALEGLRGAHKLQPDSPKYAKALAFCLARTGRIDESFACFREVMGEAEAHYNVGRMCYQLKEDDQARKHMRLALEASPNMEAAREYLAEMEGPSDDRSAIVAVGFEVEDEDEE